MPNITVVDRSGAEQTIEAQAGLSLMENIRDAGFSDMVAMCGGCCSCATCHVYIDEAWAGTVGEASVDESELLDTSSCRKGTSRLSCQIEVTDQLDGIRVTIAPED